MTAMPLRILLIEDDPNLSSWLGRALERHGHAVTVANDGVQGLRAFHANVFDLIITDLVMPDIEGLHVIRQVAGHSSRPPIIAMSGGGYGPAGTYLELAVRFGAAAGLQKPFTELQLLEAVETAMRRGA